MNISKILPESEFGKFKVVDFSKPLDSPIAQVFEEARQSGEGIILKDLTSVTKPEEQIAVLSELDKGNEMLQNGLDSLASLGKALQKIQVKAGRIIPAEAKIKNIVTQTKSNIPVFIAEKAGKTPSDLDTAFFRPGRAYGFLNYEA